MAAIWKQPICVDLLPLIRVDTVAHLGIAFLEVRDEFIRSHAPVAARTRRPLGIRHGGVRVVLAETLGSRGAPVLARPPARNRSKVPA